MRTPRRRIAAATALAVLTTVVAACGGNGGGPTTGNATGRNGGAGSGAAGEPSPLGGAAHGRLLFRDEFDGGALDTATWTPLRGRGDATHSGPFNPQHEKAAFEASQVSVADGELRLAAERRDVTVDGATYPYASGVVTTEGKFDVTHGFVETRMLVPPDTGYWPAAWLVSSRHEVREIDYAEFTTTPAGDYQPNLNMHWGDDWSSAQQLGWIALGERGRGYGGTWHTYGLRWSPGRLETYVDGAPGPVVTHGDVPGDPMYLVLDLAVHKERDPAPAVMRVDYVRVWA